MFHKILVALDTSKFNKYIFGKALAQAKLTNAQLYVLHVLSPDENGSPDVMAYLRASSPEASDRAEKHSQKLWEEFSQNCLQMLQSRAEEAKAAGVYTEFSQIPGSPGLTICEVAQNWNADLIVVGQRRHRSKVEELLLGSVSNYVLHHSPCDVLVVTRCG